LIENCSKRVYEGGCQPLSASMCGKPYKIGRDMTSIDRRYITLSIK